MSPQQPVPQPSPQQPVKPATNTPTLEEGKRSLPPEVTTREPVNLNYERFCQDYESQQGGRPIPNNRCEDALMLPTNGLVMCGSTTDATTDMNVNSCFRTQRGQELEIQGNSIWALARELKSRHVRQTQSLIPCCQFTLTPTATRMTVNFPLITRNSGHR